MDSITFQIFAFWEISEAIIRNNQNDWRYGTRELNNNVDMNRLFQRVSTADPYDYNYWSTKENGVDCNGNVGTGYYCYCPSQGY